MKGSRIIFYAAVCCLPVLANAQNDSKKVVPKEVLEAETGLIEGMKYYNAEEYKKAAEVFKQIVDKKADEAGIIFMLAKSYANLKEVPKAIVYAEQAAEKSDNKFYQQFLAELYTKQTKYKEAANIYQKLIKKHPSEIENYFELSEVYLMQEKYSDAVKVYDDIEKEVGINEEISRQKQLIYLQQNKVDEAIKEGNKLMVAEPMEFGFVIQQAQMLLANERYDEAQKMLKKSLETNPKFAEGHVLLAETYRLQGNLDKSNEELKSAFSNNDLSPEIKAKILSSYVLTINKNSSSKNVDNVIELTEQLIKQAPDNAQAYVVLGDMLKQKGDKKAARDAYVKSTDYDKSIFEVWTLIIDLDNELQDNTGLVKHTALAVEYFPNQAVLWYYNGLGNYAIKDFEEAEYSLDEAKNLAFSNKELSTNVNALLGDVFNAQKKYKKSNAAYEAALKADPNNEQALNNYSYFSSLRGENLERAKELSKKLVEKYPENAIYLDTHAWVLYQQSDYENAREYLKKAAAQANASGTVIEHYGDALFKLGNKIQAIIQWQKAKAKGGASSQIDDKIAKQGLIE
jgi:tetratricopeptide (TPR) repeat protein